MSGRLVAVFGYSDRSTDALHPVCAARLERAEAEATAEDVVLLSGRARRREPASEAELMRRAWRGRAASILVDHRARTTFGNARGAARVARAHGAQEVVLVTSAWHRRRAETLLRAALRPEHARVTVVPTDERGSLRARARELLSWTFVPFLAAVASRSR